MRLCNIELPKINPENAKVIIGICQKIHQDAVDKRKRNTILQQWDKYWVDAYDAVLEALTATCDKTNEVS